MAVEIHEVQWRGRGAGTLKLDGAWGWNSSRSVLVHQSVSSEIPSVLFVWGLGWLVGWLVGGGG